MIVKLLVAAKGNEPGYIVRSLQVMLGLEAGNGVGLRPLAQETGASHATCTMRQGSSTPCTFPL